MAKWGRGERVNGNKSDRPSAPFPPPMTTTSPPAPRRRPKRDKGAKTKCPWYNTRKTNQTHSRIREKTIFNAREFCFSPAQGMSTTGTQEGKMTLRQDAKA